MATRALLLLAVVAAFAGCGGSSSPETAGTAEPGAVRELVSVDQLSSAFAADEGVARLVLLLSPT